MNEERNDSSGRLSVGSLLVLVALCFLGVAAATTLGLSGFLAGLVGAAAGALAHALLFN